jgi:hypothetical protein
MRVLDVCPTQLRVTGEQVGAGNISKISVPPRSLRYIYQYTNIPAGIDI